MVNIDGSTWQSEEPNFYYSIRCPYDDLSDFESITLMTDQEGILISENGVLARYSSGVNRINQALIPSPRKFAGITIGKRNPANAELWIINTRRPGSYEWKIGNIEVLDNKTKNVIPLKIDLQYSADIINSQDFINYYIGKGGGYVSSISASDIHKDLFLKESLKIKELLRKDLDRGGKNIKNDTRYLDDLSETLKLWLIPRLRSRGMNLKYLDIDKVEVDLDCIPSWRHKLILMQMELESPVISSRFENATKETREEEILEEDPPILKNLPDITHQGYRSLNIPHIENDEIGIVYCAQCSKKHLTNEKFCPSCGNEYRPCPNCKSDNLKEAKRCVNCGVKLKESPPPTICHKCGANVIPGSGFCPNCGEAQLTTNPDIKICPRCKSRMSALIKFCSKCGYKI